MTAEQEDPNADGRLGRTGKITYVTGRRSQSGGHGLPALDKIAVELDDGQLLEFQSPAPGDEATLEVVAPIFARSFWVCPICVSATPTEQEHVPQTGLGGRVMTTTCAPCNNDLGSRVEAELQDWYDGALVNVAFEHEDIRGRRRLGRVFYRSGPDHFGLIVEGSIGSDVRQMLAAGSFNLHFRQPDPLRYRLALLKHAYLAACLYLGYVPEFPEADAIRADLVAARDSPKNASLPTCEPAARLRIHRSHHARQGPSLAIVATVPSSGAQQRDFYISLAGTVFVSWPFSVVPARHRLRGAAVFT